MLEALQISVVASRETATVNGVLPSEPPTLSTLQRAWACTFGYAQEMPSPKIPFRLTLNLLPIKQRERRVAEVALR